MEVVVVFLVLVAISCQPTGAYSSDGISQSKDSSSQHRKHYNIVLIGATGNLASKYLWKALFDLFRQRFSKNEALFHFYGAARQEQDVGQKIMNDIFLNVIKCSDDDCHEKKVNFVESSQYLRLTSEQDFQELAALLNKSAQNVNSSMDSPSVASEAGRLVYLSIPPSSYPETSKLVNQYLRPKIGRPWFRVVLEKPFGKDHLSAQKLAAALESHFNEDEIYRIDHYLGKAVVREILPFRFANRAAYESIWNREYVERVDVVMKETDDVLGRTTFYNEVGVIRDVMQNHLTEMMALVAMELPDDSANASEILRSKVRILRDVRPPTVHSTLTAQYSTYNAEWRREHELSNNVSKTATFAASILFIDNYRWDGVPFVLMSGKKLDEKSSYVRILFKNARFCMRATERQCNWQKQLAFYIGGTTTKLPSTITASRGLPSPIVTAGWSVKSPEADIELFGQSVGEMVQLVPDKETEPYVELIGAVMDGTRHLFVTTEALLASWKIWTPILDLAERHLPRQYVGQGNDDEILDFVVTSTGIFYQLREKDVHVTETLLHHHPIYANLPSEFRNSSLVSGSEATVVKALVQQILRVCESKIEAGGVFHLALPGGSTPVPLFLELSLAPLPWELVHLWLVDERCIVLSDERSNFNLLNRHLLSKVQIPYDNVHPILVDVADELCSPGPTRADSIYEHSIRRHLSRETFDFIVLGVGNDGHVASLFPHQLPLPGHLVTYTETKEHPFKRVTLTYELINRADHVAVLVLGNAKHEIMTLISESDNVSLYPVLAIKPKNGSLTWYIDHDALFGQETLGNSF